MAEFSTAKLNKVQQSFLDSLIAGVNLAEALEAHQLQWGSVANWRRWNPAFRLAHDQALQVGLPKRRLIRRLLRIQASCGNADILDPGFAKLLENARARVDAARADPRTGARTL